MSGLAYSPPIVNDLTTGGTTKVLSAEQGKTLKTQITELSSTGVLSGLVVSAQDTPDMTVKVSAGVAYLPSGERVEVDAVSSIAITEELYSDADPRHDLIYLSSAGVVTYLPTVLARDAVAGFAAYAVTTNFVAGDALTIDGVTLTATEATTDGDNFAVGGTVSTTETNIVSAINANTTLSAIYTAVKNTDIEITETVAGGGNTPSDAVVVGTGVLEYSEEFLHPVELSLPAVETTTHATLPSGALALAKIQVYYGQADDENVSSDYIYDRRELLTDDEQTSTYFVDDEAGDFTTIQAAIDHVKTKNGNFTVNIGRTGYSSTTDDIVISGYNKGTLHIDGYSYYEETGTTVNSLDIENNPSANIFVSNIYPSGYATYADDDFEGNAAIRVYNSPNVVFKDCAVASNTAETVYGIHASHCNLEIDGATIDGDATNKLTYGIHHEFGNLFLSDEVAFTNTATHFDLNCSAALENTAHTGTPGTADMVLDGSTFTDAAGLIHTSAGTLTPS